MISRADIKPDKNQPRQFFDKEKLKALAESYKKDGLIDPITVNGNNTIVVGEMRWRAAGIAKIDELPCIVKEYDSAQDKLRVRIKEDYHKAAWTDFERGKAYHDFIASLPAKDAHNVQPSDKGFTIASNELGIDRRQLSRYASFYEKVLEETEGTQEAIKQNKIGRVDFEAIEKTTLPKSKKEKYKKAIIQDKEKPENEQRWKNATDIQKTSNLLNQISPDDEAIIDDVIEGTISEKDALKAAGDSAKIAIKCYSSLTKTFKQVHENIDSTIEYLDYLDYQQLKKIQKDIQTTKESLAEIDQKLYPAIKTKEAK